jgi:hypothetical protein
MRSPLAFSSRKASHRSMWPTEDMECVYALRLLGARSLNGRGVYRPRSEPTAGVARKDRFPIAVPNGVDNALLMSFEDLNAACRFGMPNPHRAVMRRRKNVSLILTPGHGSNRARVPGIGPQAFARLRIPEPNITSAGKEPTPVGMPDQRLDMGSRPIDHPQAPPGVDLPQPDCPVPAAR